MPDAVLAVGSMHHPFLLCFLHRWAWTTACWMAFGSCDARRHPKSCTSSCSGSSARRRARGPLSTRLSLLPLLSPPQPRDDIGRRPSLCRVSACSPFGDLVPSSQQLSRSTGILGRLTKATPRLLSPRGVSQPLRTSEKENLLNSHFSLSQTTDGRIAVLQSSHFRQPLGRSPWQSQDFGSLWGGCVFLEFPPPQRISLLQPLCTTCWLKESRLRDPFINDLWTFREFQHVQLVSPIRTSARRKMEAVSKGCSLASLRIGSIPRTEWRSSFHRKETCSSLLGFPLATISSC